MRDFLKPIILLVLLVMLFLGACGGEDDPDITLPDITPTNTDWDILIGYGTIEEDAKTFEALISAIYLPTDHSALNADDTAEMIINDVSFPMVSMFGALNGIWFAEDIFVLNPGTSYEFKFVYDGQVKAECTLKLPAVPVASWPTMFDPLEDTSFDWTLTTNSQYQFAGVSAYNNYTQNEDEFSSELPPSEREFNIPAGAVADLGMGTEYELYVGEFNFKRVNRVAFSAIASDTRIYGADKALEPKERLLKIRKLITDIRGF